jgi:two-component sensor histidine kinase
MDRRIVIGIVLFCFWTIFAVLEASSTYWMLQSSDQELHRDISWGELFLLAVAELYIWAAFTGIVIWLGQRYPLERGLWRRSLGVHLLAGLVLACLYTALAIPVNEQLRVKLPKVTGSPEKLRGFCIAKIYSGNLIYWLILGITHAFTYHGRYRERELRASQLESQLVQAQLQMLKMQLHPHFLFNTLNAISALMHQDVELADRMVARLGELLRSTLENAGTQEVSLQQELDFIKPYLEIEQARLGPRLTVQMKIAPDVMDARVPNLLLQPLVENAIRHGIAPRSDPGRIEITARRDGDHLTLAVRDDGPGLNGHARNGKKGIGLENTRARLEQLYGPEHRFEVGNAPGRGLLATVVIPLREEPAETSVRTAHHGIHPNADRG